MTVKDLAVWHGITNGDYHCVASVKVKSPGDRLRDQRLFLGENAHQATL